ncbi:inorganic anion transporter, SulP family [Veillonella sp. oral taxon 158 str. F0412]|nr:inorganic anion transporter, SulP family [Veillonella sp. oral taxon 158 str. F0412]
MFAIQKAYLNGSLSKDKWSNNIIAGLVVGVVALPLAMAFAIASGVTPQAGIYTAIIAGIFVWRLTSTNCGAYRSLYCLIEQYRC